MSYEQLAENHQWEEWGGGGLVGVNLFWRSECLDSARSFLNELGFREVLLDCLDAQRDSVHGAIQRALGLPDWFGDNWNAYYEAFEGGFGIEPTDRIAFVVLNAEALEPETLHSVIDGAAIHDREFLFAGGRLAVLVQSSDANLTVERVGAQVVGWNPREWLNANRGPS